MLGLTPVAQRALSDLFRQLDVYVSEQHAPPACPLPPTLHCIHAYTHAHQHGRAPAPPTPCCVWRSPLFFRLRRDGDGLLTVSDLNRLHCAHPTWTRPPRPLALTPRPPPHYAAVRSTVACQAEAAQALSSGTFLELRTAAGSAAFSLLAAHGPRADEAGTNPTVPR